MDDNSNEEVLKQLKAATREARECLKDFKATIREYNSLVDEWKEKVDKQIGEEVYKGLQEFAKIQKKSEEAASQAVFARFDKLYDILMTGGDHTQPSVEALIIERAKRRETFKFGGNPPLSDR